MSKIIPNAFSSANLLCGMIAMGLSLEGLYAEASIAILLGMVFDALDGNVARLLNAGSEFGKQMDALCDLVSFGAAPAVLLYLQLYATGLNWLNLLPILAFPVCGALRLARFNSSPATKGGFVGMPITAAGGILAICSLSWAQFGVIGILLFTALLGFLMVSTIRYPDIKSVSFLKKKLGIALSLLSIALYVYFLSEWLFLPLVGYALTGLFLGAWQLIKSR